MVLRECPTCRVALRGDDSLIATPWKPADFCWSCGMSLPWVSRRGIVYAIQNMLDEQQLVEGDRRQLEEQLGSLLETPSEAAIERRQQRALEMLRRLAPAAWEKAWPVAAAILTAEVKRQLGLPP